MKKVLIILSMLFLQYIYGQTPEIIQKDYTMIWVDNFTGLELDTTKWNYRSLGDKRVAGVVAKENSYLDGKGNLVIEVTKKDSVYFIGQVGSQKLFSAKFGYFECRAKMNRELGPHVAFWLQSPTIQLEKDNPKDFGTEIDIFEYHINEGKEWVYHNLHWDGYGGQHKSTGTKIKIENLDSGFHTFGLLWTEDEYVFYVDGVETWRTSEAVSHIEEYIILSAELTGWGGDYKQATFPDRVLFDYVKVYQKSEL